MKISGRWINSEEILNKTEEWHDGAGEGLELYEYLGLTWKEYLELIHLEETQSDN